jgi:hypothetical protein
MLLGSTPCVRCVAHSLSSFNAVLRDVWTDGLKDAQAGMGRQIYGKTDGECCGSRTYISAVADGRIDCPDCHARGLPVLRNMLAPHVPAVPVSHCAECEVGLWELDFLCKQCRDATAELNFKLHSSDADSMVS